MVDFFLVFVIIDFGGLVGICFISKKDIPCYNLVRHVLEFVLHLLKNILNLKIKQIENLINQAQFTKINSTHFAIKMIQILTFGWLE